MSGSGAGGAGDPGGPAAWGADTVALPAPPEVVQIEVGLLDNFCEILFCPESREAAIVDPAWEVDRLLREVERLGLRVTAALITHGHADHVEGVGELCSRTGARVVVDPRELGHVREAAGTALGEIELVSDRRDIAIGQRGVRALETVGHTVGGTSYLADGYVVTGDVLFVGGCGRTDFPGGDTAALWRSLQRLAALPEETRVFPGHNYGSTPTSTMGRELIENPYMRAATFEEFRALRERRQGSR